MPFSPEQNLQYACFHNGGAGTVAGKATRYSTCSLIDENSPPVTVEYEIKLMSPVEGDCMAAWERVIKNGKRLKFCQSVVFLYESGNEMLYSIAIVTLMELKCRPVMSPC